ncbi:MAG: cytochrome b/b6 domain-containing protein [Pseudomonadota bacterium]
MPHPTGYSRVQILLHWAVVILIVFQFVAHDGIGDAFRTGIRTGTWTITLGAGLHLLAGSLILLLAMVRLVLRRERGAPQPPETGAQALAAKLAHGALYVMMLGLPVGGAIAWANGSRQFAQMHELGANLLLGLIALHVAAAFFGQFVQKSGVISRMIKAEKP